MDVPPRKRKPSPPSRRGPGRPSKLTPETQAAIVEAVRLGMTRERAAARVGIDVSTLQRWLAKGEMGGANMAKYRAFREAVTRAEPEGEAALLSLVHRAARGSDGPADWKAAAWILERRHAETYGRRDKVEHSGAIGGDAEARRLAEAEARRLVRAALEEEMPTRPRPTADGPA